MRPILPRLGSIAGARTPSWLAGALALAGLFAPPCRADDVTLELGKNKLTVRPPEGLAAQDSANPDCRLIYSGVIEGSEVQMTLWAYSKEKFAFNDPEHLAKNYEVNERINSGTQKFAFASTQAVGGPYGVGGYAVLGLGDLPDSASKTGEVIVLCAVLDQWSYYVRVATTPALPAAAKTTLIEYLRFAVRAESPGMDPKWTDAEAQALWARAVKDPQLRKQMKPPARSAHYIVLTNGGSGARWAAQMEKAFGTIQKVLPDDVGAAPRLLPVIVFAKADQYYAYYVSASGRTLEMAKRTACAAIDDTYATFEGAKDDADHVRAPTMQYLRAYLRLDGGGWWFRQGLVAYMYEKPGDLKSAAAAMARKGSHLAFNELVVREGHGDPGDDALIDESASVIAFLREGPLGPQKFMVFVRRLGSVTAPDLAKVEAIVKEVYGMDLAAFESAWMDYWSHR